MKIMVLGNQARALVNFWSVLMEYMRLSGHDLLCCVPDHVPDAAPWLPALAD